MKNRLWRQVGVLAYWLGWPIFWFYLRGSERSRILLVCTDEMLVVKGWLSDGRWGLPGGGLEDGEKPEQGALRELAEETSIKLTKPELQLMASETFRGAGHKFNCHYFLATVRHMLAVKPQKGEIVDASWIKINSINHHNASPDVLRAIELWKTAK